MLKIQLGVLVGRAKKGPKEQRLGAAHIRCSDTNNCNKRCESLRSSLGSSLPEVLLINEDEWRKCAGCYPITPYIAHQELLMYDIKFNVEHMFFH